MSLRKMVFACVTLGCVCAWAGAARAVDFQVTRCEANVELYDITIDAQVCRPALDDPVGAVNASLKVWFHNPSDPGSSATPDVSLPLGLIATPGCSDVSYPPPLVPFQLPNGKYKLWCRVDAAGDTDSANNVNDGGFDYVVGPDLWPYSFWITKEGDTTNYYAIVCNTGTDVARNFRVGFYYDREPAPNTYSDAFKSVDALAPAYHWFWGFAYWMCKEILYKRTPTPNATYHSWVKVDDGEFVDEADETNNTMGELTFTMSNADLVIEHFNAIVSAAPPYRVDYEVTVCNRGTATAGVFWIDLYYDRDGDDPPQLGQPGDQNFGWPSLPPETCVEHVFTRLNVPPTTAAHPEYESWVQADADEFVYDPDRSTNLEGPMELTVPGGVIASGCPDADGDGYGIGSDCQTLTDCNDADASIHPGAEEVCGDGVDQNCNGTPDDGCEGVDCIDEDGDGWPTGPDCVISDCDDTDPTRYPGAIEICGDNIDQDCDGIPDDCCEGVSCCDEDNDGYGVGPGCPGGVQDCDDSNPAAGSPDAEEICNDNVDNDCDGLVDENCEGSYCDDVDGDGYGVGVGCTGPQDPDDTDPNIHPGAVEDCSNAIDDDGNGVINDGCPGCVDHDGDGYGVGDDCLPSERDCNDEDDTIYPGAPEVCDLIDNNCNHTVDEGTPGNQCPEPDCAAACDGDQSCIDDCPLLNCIDSDGDGWGVGSGCQIEDCDDNNFSINPGVPDDCNDAIDNDCDHTVNDGCPGVDCVDHDGDGWGVGPGCAEGWEDPDDTDPAVWPGAPEICGDGIDQSGDGIPDEGCVLCVDHDGDGYGVGPFCGVRDCNDDDPDVHPGATETCSSVDRNCDGVTSVSTACAESCDCSHRGGSPVGRWPEATVLLVLLLALLRRKRE